LEHLILWFKVLVLGTSLSTWLLLVAAAVVPGTAAVAVQVAC